jgi:hypothetical protein
VIATLGRSPLGALYRSSLAVHAATVPVGYYIGGSIYKRRDGASSHYTRVGAVAYNYATSTFEINAHAENAPAFADNGTLQVSVEADGTVTVEYCGITVTDTTKNPLTGSKWWIEVWLQQTDYGINPTPCEQYDNFRCGGFSDNFNRAPGALLSHAGTEWVDILENGVLDIRNNALAPTSFRTGAMYWDERTAAGTLTVSMDVGHLRDLEFNAVPRSWLLQFRLYNDADEH